jgi:hypothetical protein
MALPLKTLATTAHEDIFRKLYQPQIVKAKQAIAGRSSEDIDVGAVQQHVQSELKETLRAFHRRVSRDPNAEGVAEHTVSLDRHASEVVTFCCRAAGVMRDAQGGGDAGSGGGGGGGGGEIVGSMKHLLRLRSTSYAKKARQKKSRRALRAIQKRYLREVAPKLRHTAAYGELLGELSGPVLEAMGSGLEKELLQNDGLAAGADMGATLFEEGRTQAHSDFAKAVREWGLSPSFGTTKLEKAARKKDKKGEAARNKEKGNDEDNDDDESPVPDQSEVDQELEEFIGPRLDEALRRERIRLWPLLEKARDHYAQNKRVAVYRQTEAERAAR